MKLVIASYNKNSRHGVVFQRWLFPCDPCGWASVLIMVSDSEKNTGSFRTVTSSRKTIHVIIKEEPNKLAVSVGTSE